MLAFAFSILQTSVPRKSYGARVSEIASNFNVLIDPYRERKSPQVRRENAKTEKNGPQPDDLRSTGRLVNALELFGFSCVPKVPRDAL